MEQDYAATCRPLPALVFRSTHIHTHLLLLRTHLHGTAWNHDKQMLQNRLCLQHMDAEKCMTTWFSQERDPISMPVHPDTLTWTAWLLRVVEKDIRERGKRVLRERIEESLMPEEVRSTCATGSIFCKSLCAQPSSHARFFTFVKVLSFSM